MAYRFLLEVSNALAAEASVAVEQTDDAQVILVRDSHGLGFEDSFVDLTVAAHTLRVIDSLYEWFDSLGASRPDVRIVLHGGERMSLEGHDRGAMIGAIRRDQPWVERSIPKVGDHEPAESQAGDNRAGLAEADVTVDSAGGNAPTATVDRESPRLSPFVPAAIGRDVHLRSVSHISVQVNDVAKAERFYADFLNMAIAGRAKRDERGVLQVFNGAVEGTDPTRLGEGPDVSFLSNGPVRLALQRAGRGARLERGVIDHLSIAVDARTFVTLKAEALVRPLTILGTSDTTFTFRDPFNVVWELVIESSATRINA